MMSLLPVGLLGLVFAALVAAIIASTASKINSVATIFTLDLYAKMKRVESRAQDAGQDADLTSAHERQLVFVGRITAVVATLLAIFKIGRGSCWERGGQYVETLVVAV